MRHGPESTVGRLGDSGIEGQVARVFRVRLKLGPPDMGEDEFHALKPEALSETLKEEAWKAQEKRETEFGKEDLKSIEKYFLLQIIDHQWVDHLQDMESMKEGIGLRGYGQLDPLREYKKEGFALFEGLMDRIKRRDSGDPLAHPAHERKAERGRIASQKGGPCSSAMERAGKNRDGQKRRQESRTQ